MALNPDKNLKLYYSIKEVAQMFGVNESTLRYWEKEFPEIKPKVSANKVRQYQQKDIDQLRIIHNLIKKRGFKIAAARKMMYQNRDGSDRTAQILTTLEGVRDELVRLKGQLGRLT